MEALLAVILVHLPIGLIAWLLSVFLWEKYRSTDKKDNRYFRFGVTLIAIDLLVLWWEGDGLASDGLEGWATVKLVAYVLIQGSLTWLCVKGYRWYKSGSDVSVSRATLKTWLTWSAIVATVVFAYYWYWDFDPFSCPGSREENFVAEAKAGVQISNVAFEKFAGLMAVDQNYRNRTWMDNIEKHLGDWVAIAEMHASTEPPTGRTKHIQQSFERHTNMVRRGTRGLIEGLQRQDTSLMQEGTEYIVYAMEFIDDVSWEVDSFCPSPQPPILGFPRRGQ